MKAWVFIYKWLQVEYGQPNTGALFENEFDPHSLVARTTGSELCIPRISFEVNDDNVTEFYPRINFNEPRKTMGEMFQASYGHRQVHLREYTQLANNLYEALGDKGLVFDLFTTPDVSTFKPDGSSKALELEELRGISKDDTMVQMKGVLESPKGPIIYDTFPVWLAKAFGNTDELDRIVSAVAKTVDPKYDPANERLRFLEQYLLCLKNLGADIY